MLVPDNNDNSPFKVPGRQDEIPTSPLEVMKRQFLPKPPKFATKNKNKTVYREDVEKAAKLGFFLGWLGIHNFKINRTVIGLLQMCLGVGGIGFLLVPLFFGGVLAALFGASEVDLSISNQLSVIASGQLYIPLLCAFAWGIIDSIYLLATKDKYPSKNDVITKQEDNNQNVQPQE